MIESTIVEPTTALRDWLRTQALACGEAVYAGGLPRPSPSPAVAVTAVGGTVAEPVLEGTYQFGALGRHRPCRRRPRRRADLAARVHPRPSSPPVSGSSAPPARPRSLPRPVRPGRVPLRRHGAGRDDQHLIPHGRTHHHDRHHREPHSDEVLLGAGTLYVAQIGTTEPASASPATLPVAWREIGWTEDGSTFNYEITTADIGSRRSSTR